MVSTQAGCLCPLPLPVGSLPNAPLPRAYDLLERQGRPDKAYLRLLLLAARESEAAVDAALRQLIDQGRAVTVEAMEACLQSEHLPNPVVDVIIPAIELRAYDALLTEALSC